MIKIAITADLHFRAKRLADIKKGWDELIGNLISKEVDYLLIAGDVFHNFNISGNTSGREASFGTIYHAFKSGLNMFTDKGGTVFIIPGNHDIAGLNDKDALEALNGAPQVNVIREPMGIDINNDIHLRFLPWLSDRKPYKDVDLVSKAQQSGCNILIGHCEVEGTAIKDSYSLFGGDFEFSQDSFNTKGYDHIALGHIHKRMDHYVGSPWHLSYDDAGHPAGFDILTIENGKITKKENVELHDAPRYQIYTGGITEATHRETDYIRVDYRGDTPPDIGSIKATEVEMKKIPDPNTIQARVDIKHDASVKDLLVTWLGANSRHEDIGVLMDYIDRNAMQNYQQSIASGSLERVRNIGMKYIGPHENTDISFNEEQFIAVSGHNGAGKSFAVDSLIAAPFGEFPSQSEVLMENITLGHEGEAEVSQVFDSNGQTYRARRIFNKGKQKGFLSRLVDAGMDTEEEVQLAGPKITEFDREIYKLLGDKKLVLSSVFSAQGDKGDIVSVKPSERRDILSQIIGASGLSVISEQAKKEAARINVEIGVAKEGIARIKEGNHEEYIESKTVIIEAEKKKHALLDTDLQACLTLLKDAEEEGRECGSRKAKIVAAAETLKQLIAEISILNERKKAVGDDIKAKRALIARRPQITKDVDRVNAAKAEYEKHRDQVNADLKVKQQVSSVEKAIQSQEAAINTEKTRLLNDMKALQKEEEAMTLAFDAGMKSIDAEIRSLENKEKLLQKAGCKNSPLPCEFINDGLLANDHISDLRSRKKALSEEHQGFIDTNKASILDIGNALNGDRFAEKSRGEVARLQDEKEQLSLKLIPGVQEEELSLLKAVMGTEREALESLQAIKVADAVLAELHAKETDIVAETNIKLIKQGELEGEVQFLEEVTNDHLSLQREWKRLDERRTGIYDNLIETSNLITRLEGEVKGHREKLEEMTALEANVSTKEEGYEHYNVIADAFGRNGIPQLLIASALPQIQDTLNILLGVLDNKFCITFSTLEEKKSGKINETLDILVSDGRGERKIERFSGGEKKLLKAVIRIALGVFMSQRSGRKYQVFVVDEAFDALDKDNARKMLQILLTLKDRFNQVFVVSHEDSLLIEFPARLEFKTKNNVSYCDFIKK